MSQTQFEHNGHTYTMVRHGYNDYIEVYDGDQLIRSAEADHAIEAVLVDAFTEEEGMVYSDFDYEMFDFMTRNTTHERAIAIARMILDVKVA